MTSTPIKSRGGAVQERPGLLRILVLLGFFFLGACATEPEPNGSGRPIDFPRKAEVIDLAETDLALPLSSPLEISAVSERVSEGQVFENIYRFHQVKGFLRSSRVVFGYFSDNTSRSLRHQGFFEAFAGERLLRRDIDLELGPTYRFQNGDPHTQGFYAFAGEDPYFDSCFVARIGYLLVDYASVPSEEDSVDTIVEVFLCGDLPPKNALLDFLAQVKTVQDRAAYRRELSRRPVGTI